MVILAMRNPGERVDEGHRLVVVRERERFFDAVALELPARKRRDVLGELIGGEPIGIVLASGAGALGIQIGGPLQQLGGDPYFRPDLGVGEVVQSEILPSAVGLVWRALVLWLLLLLLITLANWAP